MPTIQYFVELEIATTRSLVDDMLKALTVARDALRANEEITGTWELYQHSPEMKTINGAIANALKSV